jgi:hypothetical protein
MEQILTVEIVERIIGFDITEESLKSYVLSNFGKSITVQLFPYMVLRLQVRLLTGIWGNDNRAGDWTNHGRN